ncbi:geranylgeranyl diphosphate synthase type I [Actinoplanes campanulatus]|uniref:Geranylgeranyl diphosphate synthase type I n=1 Tax=Actinoplanes campanulatus TaxID=113559 RepID=A0A7W5FCK3_9ACTN|nr:polyprenyl synthetase family protein [Actinoplanes campanulatus]MBB3093503.1 geranylgeranyl diphosphate synthase type I [Actinoplanes campanulatus]GGN03804.1 geranylgeranyl pyrophosphate synthase [Actinoplanes campanulatus]GID35424.1 geranylgeranyl pyrophosphate synthase [Actinoplanes campanulatus]
MTNSPLESAGLRPRVDKALSGFLATQRAHLLEIDTALAEVADAVSAFVLGGGKRLRPAFAYWGFRGAGGADSDEVVAAVSALELVQASALIHDDLMDRSDTRRGEPSVHRRFELLHTAEGWRGAAAGFGDSAALLLGDLAMVWSDELLHSSGMALADLARARPVFDQMRTEVTVGQYLDVLTQATGDTSLERAGKVARFKSAKYTVERPLLLGAALAGGGPEVFASYAAFGLPLGEAFQMRDDVLGVYGDPAQTGKPAGDDLREGKRTYLVAAAYQAVDEATRQYLESALGDPALDDTGVERLRTIIREAGALAATESRIETLTTEALTALAEAPIEDEARTVLHALAEASTHRSV